MDLSAVALQLAAALRGPAASSRPLGTRLHPVAVHGNYRRYYGYRLDGAFGTDPRLQARCYKPCLGYRDGEVRALKRGTGGCHRRV